jgi:small conductance mechanosensitive channel
MNVDLQAFRATAIALMTQVGLKIIGAIVLFIIGRWLIALCTRLITRSLTARGIDKTVGGYIASTVAALLNIALVVAILGFFGVQTTTFAALLAAAGLAIGTAWGGLLANFAAGAFLVILRPFHVGDFISAGGVTGTVKEIGLFVTTILTPDNVVNFVGNNKIFADNIQNYSASDYRRVDLVAQLANQVDHQDAITRLQKAISAIPKVLQTPAPDVEIASFTPSGPVLAVRPYCKHEDYWPVYFATNRAIRETFGEAGYPVPEQPIALRTFAAAAAASSQG